MRRDKEVRIKVNDRELEVIRDRAKYTDYCVSEYLRLLLLGYLVIPDTKQYLLRQDGCYRTVYSLIVDTKQFL